MYVQVMKKNFQKHALGEGQHLTTLLGTSIKVAVCLQPPARQLPTSDQQAKQQAEAVKQAQLFFAQSKPTAPEPTAEDGLVVNESSDDKALPPKEAAEE